ncbi:MAG: hypothetical protein IIC52_12930 [Proteobacteria bacterium]|nr:hypothetical protein [Pseudomonadota bacterium]
MAKNIGNRVAHRIACPGALDHGIEVVRLAPGRLGSWIHDRHGLYNRRGT